MYIYPQQRQVKDNLLINNLLRRSRNFKGKDYNEGISTSLASELSKSFEKS